MLLSARMSCTYRPATETNANASNTTDVAPTKTVAAVKAASLISRGLRTRFAHILMANSPSNAGISILHPPPIGPQLEIYDSLMNLGPMIVSVERRDWPWPLHARFEMKEAANFEAAYRTMTQRAAAPTAVMAAEIANAVAMTLTHSQIDTVRFQSALWPRLNCQGTEEVPLQAIAHVPCALPAKSPNVSTS
jgi:hypothetical protein